MSESVTDYRAMWEELGLNLDKHDMLLGALGQMYGDIYMSQSNRPAGMDYFNFVMSEIHGLRVKELLDARAEGRKIVGAFCVFVPEELVLAVDAVCVGLCAGAQWAFEEAETLLPRSTCALIKSFFGFALDKVCPYLSATDLLVGENTCDGKKKAYEIFDQQVSDVYVMDMPQMKSDAGRALLLEEFRKFARKLEELTGKTITVDNLKQGIEVVNNKRRAMHRLAALRAADPTPISGLDALLANQVYFYDDPVRFTGAVNALCDELETRVEQGVGVAPKGTPRILMSGCPQAAPNWKLHSVVEGAGAILVGEESCVGERGTQNLVDPEGETVDELIEKLVDRYFQIDCAVFTPNSSRIDHVNELAGKVKADGVIHYALQFCQPYQIESLTVENEMEGAGVPVLRIDTDYSMEDVGQLGTRIEAFVERLKG